MFLIFELIPPEKVDVCRDASLTDANKCIIEEYDSIFQLDICHGFVDDCPIIIPETEQECRDLYETYKSMFKTSDRLLQLPVQYSEYEQRRCNV